MDTVLEATVNRIKSFEDNDSTTKLSEDLDYAVNSISKQETKAALISGDFIETCFTLCQNEALSASHRVQCLQIVGQLAVLYSARQRLVELIPAISELLRSEADSVRLHCCRLVSTVCSFQDSLSAVAHSAITEIAYELLFDSSYDVATESLHALSAITNLIRSSPEKVVQKLIRSLSRTDKKEVARCESNLQCLWNVCSLREIKELALKHQVVEAVSRFLSMAFAKTEPAVCRRAAGLLMPLSVCRRGKDAIIRSRTVIGALSYLASTQSVGAEIRSNSGTVLSNVSDHPEGLQKAGKELIHKNAFIIKLFGADKAAQIAHFHLAAEKPLTQQSAVQLLALTAQQTDGGLDAVWKCPDILPELVDIVMTNDRERIMSLALDVVIALCRHRQTAQVILRKEARRSAAFLETAKKIPELQPFLTDELL